MTPEEITQTLQELVADARYLWLDRNNNDFQGAVSDLENCLDWWSRSNFAYYDTVRCHLQGIVDDLGYHYPGFTARIAKVLDAMPEMESVTA